MSPGKAQGSVSLEIERLRSPDKRVRDEAAERIWNRYFPQLLERAKRRLSPKVRRRQDEEDVLQNMYLTFCRRHEDGQFSFLKDRTDLWRILVFLTVMKARRAARHEQAQARDIRKEENAVDAKNADGDFRWILEQMAQGGPTPEEAVILADELERMLSILDPQLKEIAERKLRNETNEEIARARKCSVRTVERKLDKIGRQWRRLIDELLH